MTRPPAIPRETWVATFLGLVAICGIALLIRYYMWIMVGGGSQDYVAWAMQNFYGGIVANYIAMADLVTSGQWSGLGLVYPPGYPAFLALLRLLGADSVQNLRLAQIAVDACAIFPLWYLLGRLGSSAPVALFGCLLYALMPWWVYGSTHLLAESIMPAMVICVLALMCMLIGRRNLLAWLATGVLAGILPLVRPDMILLIGPLVVWALLVAPGQKKLPSATVFAAGFLLPVLLWASVNYYFHGQFLVTTRAQAYVLWSGLGQVANDFGYFVSDARAVQLLESLGMQYHSVDAEKYWMGQYINAWAAHPGHVIRSILHRITLILFSPSYHVGAVQYLNNTYWQGAILWLAALFVLVRRRAWDTAFLMSGPLVYALLSLGLVYVETRYVRYASLSYLMAGAVLVQEVIRQFHSGRVARVPRKVQISLAVAFCGFLAVVVCTAMLDLRAIARSQLVANAALESGLGPGPVANLEWRKIGPDAAIEAVDEGTRIESSVGTLEYQAMAHVDVGNASAILIDYTVSLHSGSFQIGVLASDESHFTVVQAIVPGKPGSDERVLNRLISVADQKGTSLVLMNNRSTPGKSIMTIERIGLFRLCLEETKSGIIDKMLLRNIGPESFRVC